MKNIKGIIWYEKYRQDSLDDLVLLDHHRRQLDAFVEEESIPHLLFHGPPGSGKTTIAMILIDHCASAFRVFNASSSDRGIATIKTTVKDFARSHVQKKEKTNIIFFDEADGLTPEAQMALKNTIERYHKNCRFIFTANHVDMVVDEIKSRCIMFKFEQVSSKELRSHLVNILENEEIEYKKRDISTLINYHSYDVRTIINDLQSASITGKFILEDVVSIFPVDKIFEMIKSGAIGEIRKITKDHTNFTWIYKRLFNDFISILDEDSQGEVSLIIAEYLWRDRAIVDKEINFSACLIEIMDLLDIQPEF